MERYKCMRQLLKACRTLTAYTTQAAAVVSPPLPGPHVPFMQQHWLLAPLPLGLVGWRPVPAHRLLANAAHAQEEQVPTQQRHPSVPKVSTDLLSSLINNPTEASWSQFAWMLTQQIPGRTQLMVEQLQDVLASLDCAPSNPPHSQDTLQVRAALKAVIKQSIDHHTQLVQKFLTHCPTPPEHSGSRLMSREEQLCVAEAAHCLKKEVDHDSEQVAASLRDITELPGWRAEMQCIKTLDAVMDQYEMFVLSMRVLLSEAMCVWKRMRRAQGLTGNGFRDSAEAVKCARWSTAGPTGPPGWEEEEAKRPPASLIYQDAPLVQLLRLAAEDTRAFCVEKNSLAPEVEIHGDERLGVTCLDAYVQHIYHEVLKNAMQALISKWGAWDVDEAEPIQVVLEPLWLGITPDGNDNVPETASSQFLSGFAQGGSDDPSDEPSHVLLTVTDTGGGMSAEQLANSMHFFSTSHKAKRHGYGYSRDHGSQFQGLGVGMPLSRVYARFMGGKIQWSTSKELGHTQVQLILPRKGFEF